MERLEVHASKVPKPEDMVMRSIYLSPETEEHLAEKANKKGKTTNQLIREILDREALE